MAADLPPELEPQFLAALEAGDVDGVLASAASAQAAGRSSVAARWLEQAFAAHPTSARVAGRLLEIHLRYHNWADFDRIAEEALSRHPADAELHYSVGCAQESRGAWSEAARAFGRAFELAPEEVEAVQRQARALRVDGRSAEALTVVQRALKRVPGEATLHAVCGYIRIELQEPLLAARAFQTALKHQPDWQPYLDDLAGALMLAERWEDAAKAATRSLHLRKRNERAWTVYAIAHHRLGDPVRADQGYRNAIRAAASPTRAQGNYGLFLAADPSRVLEAVRMLRTAYEAHPEWDEVGHMLDRLTSA